MKIDIAHIAKLSRLHFEPEQIAKFEKDMESIVAMVDHLPGYQRCRTYVPCIPDEQRVPGRCGDQRG